MVSMQIPHNPENSIMLCHQLACFIQPQNIPTVQFSLPTNLIALWLDRLLTVFDCFYYHAIACWSYVFHFSSSIPSPSHFYSAGWPYKIPTSPPILWGNIKFILQPGGPRHPSTPTALPGHHIIRQYFSNQNLLENVLP